MARPKPVDPCLFCDKVPCECNKTEAKPKAARKTQAKKPVVEMELPEPDTTKDDLILEAPREPKKMTLAAMKAAAVPVRQVTPKEPEPEPDPTSDEELARAIRALEPLLHSTEKARHRAALTAPRSLEERREAWRARHASTSSNR